MITIDMKKGTINYDSQNNTCDRIIEARFSNKVGSIINASFVFEIYHNADVVAFMNSVSNKEELMVKTFTGKQMKMYVVLAERYFDASNDTGDGVFMRIKAYFYPQFMFKYRRIYGTSSLYKIWKKEKKDLKNLDCIKSDISGTDEKNMPALISDPEGFDVSELGKSNRAKQIINDMLVPDKYLLDNVSYYTFLKSYDVLNNGVNSLSLIMDDNCEKAKVILVSIDDMCEPALFNYEISTVNNDIFSIDWLSYDIVYTPGGDIFKGYLINRLKFSNVKEEPLRSDGYFTIEEQMGKNDFMFFINSIGKGVRFNLKANSGEMKEYKFIITSCEYSYAYHGVDKEFDSVFSIGMSSIFPSS